VVILNFHTITVESISSIGELLRTGGQIRLHDELKGIEQKQMEKPVENTDIIQLNVGGEIIVTTRETLTRIPTSILMFNGRCEDKLLLDQNRNFFFDFNPVLCWNNRVQKFYVDIN